MLQDLLEQPGPQVRKACKVYPAISGRPDHKVFKVTPDHRGRRVSKAYRAPPVLPVQQGLRGQTT